MLRVFFLTAAVVAVAAVVAPSIREILAWVLAFLSALLLGDLLRSSLVKLRGRKGQSARGSA